MELYNWQKEVIETEGNLTIRCGRQVGKSEAVAERIVYLAKKYPMCKILITSPSERQEDYIYEKVKRILGDRHRYKKKPTLKLLWLNNGTKIHKIPIGRTGSYVEGLSSVDFLFVDEAMFMGRIAWDALLPMLAEPRSRGLGWVTLLSNTRGRPEGVFFESFKENSPYKKMHISAEDCPHITKEFLAEEKERLGESKYKAIYQGEFVESDYKYFPLELLNKATNIKSWTINQNLNSQYKYYLGIDPARFGKAEAGFVISEKIKDKINIIHAEIVKRSSMPELMRMTERFIKMFNLQKVYVDGGGIGGGLIYFLKEKFGSKIIDLNNAMKSLDTRNKRILKEDLNENMLRLLETNRFNMIENGDLLFSLSNIIYENEKFTGKKTDLAEACIRACWCMKENNYSPKII